jgi:enamine deaminase RidA (YjgF/YER057c/UK114 family)
MLYVSQRLILRFDRWLGEVRPAATMIEAGLADDAMKVEVEVTAFKAGGVKDDAGPMI